MIARPVWLPLLLLAAKVWAVQQGHGDSIVPAAPGHAPNQIKLVDQVAELFHRLVPSPSDSDAIAPGAVAPRNPLQTPPPALPLLRARQDNGQVAALSAQIQSLSLASSSVSQASRLVSQTSQQLAQQVTQLSQSTDRLTQSVIQLQASMQQAQQSAQQAQDAARQASQSASSAISVAITSAQSSASSAIAANLASATSSVSSMFAAASISALNIANAAASQVQSAQADATVARADAATQVQKAQGTAVSVTQAAVGIVGTFFGSSLLTIGAFYLILRYKGKKKRRRTQLLATRGTEFSNPGDGSNGQGGAYGYPADLKNPPPRKPVGAANNDTYGDEKRRPSSDYRPREDRDSSGDAAYGFAMFGSAGSADEFVGNGKAPVREVKVSNAAAINNATVSPSIYNTGRTGMSNTLTRAATTTNNPTRPPPSLQQWLSAGTVSPFGTLQRADTARESNDKSTIGQAITSGDGPAERRQQQLRAMTARSMGVGGVNAGGGSRVMQPGSSLPLRDR
ncbi:hypothetical protein F503_07774 [Ophiostoma piceae UAMH 11346]|uniref:Uncharacterized protein n=1 Tax=Ophiostoma piceae (strain UAMH 11346) TaxID=1262450 RepID=S3CKV7_OPHP1|nr:hypothetical protein F503_07774 [Ophiostoma piceae UAMH 11346]